MASHLNSYFLKLTIINFYITSRLLIFIYIITRKLSNIDYLAYSIHIEYPTN